MQITVHLVFWIGDLDLELKWKYGSGLYPPFIMFKQINEDVTVCVRIKKLLITLPFFTWSFIAL